MYFICRLSSSFCVSLAFNLTPNSSALLFSHLLIGFFRVLDKPLDQVFGSFVCLLVGLANGAYGIFHHPTPHQHICFRIDHVDHDATLLVMVGPDIRPKTPAPTPVIRNAIAPTESWPKTETRRAFNLGLRCGARIERDDEIRVL